MSDEKKIVIVSDGTGRTANRLMDAVLVQYNQDNRVYAVAKTHTEIRHKKELREILKEMDDSYLVLYSIVATDLSDYFAAQLAKTKILNLNVLKPMLDTMSKFLGVHPDYQPGLLHILDDRYYKKVDSIGYTVKHDDGCGSEIENADAVLVGPSRTCKTPISMYLACNHGLRVANIPMVRNKTMTQNLLRRIKVIKPRQVIGLLMLPEVLARVREERMNVLLSKDSHQAQMRDYYDIREVALEFRYCRDLFTSHGWQTIDVTRRAIEDIAGEILKKLGLSDPAIYR